jgi:hypothetical protein
LLENNVSPTIASVSAAISAVTSIVVLGLTESRHRTA